MARTAARFGGSLADDINAPPFHVPSHVPRNIETVRILVPLR
jgi:hypothetical protein